MPDLILTLNSKRIELSLGQPLEVVSALLGGQGTVKSMAHPIFKTLHNSKLGIECRFKDDALATIFFNVNSKNYLPFSGDVDFFGAGFFKDVSEENFVNAALNNKMAFWVHQFPKRRTLFRSNHKVIFASIPGSGINLSFSGTESIFTAKDLPPTKAKFLDALLNSFDEQKYGHMISPEKYLKRCENIIDEMPHYNTPTS